MYCVNTQGVWLYPDGDSYLRDVIPAVFPTIGRSLHIYGLERTRGLNAVFLHVYHKITFHSSQGLDLASWDNLWWQYIWKSVSLQEVPKIDRNQLQCKAANGITPLKCKQVKERNTVWKRDWSACRWYSARCFRLFLPRFLPLRTRQILPWNPKFRSLNTLPLSIQLPSDIYGSAIR